MPSLANTSPNLKMEHLLYYLELVILSISFYALLKGIDQFSGRYQILQSKSREYLMCANSYWVKRPKYESQLVEVMEIFHNTAIAYLDFRFYCQQKLSEFILISIAVGFFGYQWLGVCMFFFFVSVYLSVLRISGVITKNIKRLNEKIAKDNPEMNLPTFNYKTTNLTH